jgi:hypothetical protein
VADPKNISGHGLGDEVDITYTEAILITVKRPGKALGGALAGAEQN